MCIRNILYKVSTIAFKKINQKIIDHILAAQPKKEITLDNLYRQRAIENKHSVANERCCDRF